MSKSAIVVFDWSGTLSDSFRCWYKACNEVFKELGAQAPTETEARRTFTLPYMRFWNHYFPDLTLDAQKELYEKHIRNAGEPELFRGAKELIENLHDRRYDLFIVSSDPPSMLITELERSGIRQYFKEVIGGIHEKRSALDALATKQQFIPDDAYYIGDTSGDVNAGKQTGYNTVGVTWGFQCREALEKSKPDYIVETFLELNAVLSREQ